MIVVDVGMDVIDLIDVGISVVVVAVELIHVWSIVTNEAVGVVDLTDVWISIVVDVVELVCVWSIVANKAVGVVDLGLDVVDLTGMTTTLQSSLLDDG